MTEVVEVRRSAQHGRLVGNNDKVTDAITRKIERFARMIGSMHSKAHAIIDSVLQNSNPTLINEVIGQLRKLPDIGKCPTETEKAELARTQSGRIGKVRGERPVCRRPRSLRHERFAWEAVGEAATT